jgi:hypothetical protein
VFLTPEVGSLRGFLYCAALRWKKQQKKQKKFFRLKALCGVGCGAIAGRFAV